MHDSRARLNLQVNHKNRYQQSNSVLNEAAIFSPTGAVLPSSPAFCRRPLLILIGVFKLEVCLKARLGQRFTHLSGLCVAEWRYPWPGANRASTTKPNPTGKLWNARAPPLPRLSTREPACTCLQKAASSPQCAKPSKHHGPIMGL